MDKLRRSSQALTWQDGVVSHFQICGGIDNRQRAYAKPVGDGRASVDDDPVDDGGIRTKPSTANLA